MHIDNLFKDSGIILRFFITFETYSNVIIIIIEIDKEKIKSSIKKSVQCVHETTGSLPKLPQI